MPTTVLSLWQPLASFLAHGIQRVEGRGWSTEFRGPLWIHAGSKQPSAEEIGKWEELYREVHAMDGTKDFRLPERYPTSALVGLVEVVDVIPAADFRAWRSLPPGTTHEGRCHGSGHLFLVEKHRCLPVPLKMSGQHKLWRLDRKTASDAFRGLVESEQTPAVSFTAHRELLGSMPEVAHVPAVRAAQDDEESGGESDADEVDEYLLQLAVQRSLADAEGSAAAAPEEEPPREPPRRPPGPPPGPPPVTAGACDAAALRETAGVAAVGQAAEGSERRRGRWRK